MITGELALLAARLTAERTPFVLATVVRAGRPTSVRPGDSAVVHPDGRIDGFVGGMCAESSVTLYSLRALETGEPILLRLVPAAGESDAGDAREDAIVERNPCLSGGALEIFLEPCLPAARVLIAGSTPIAHALRKLCAAAGYDVVDDHARPGAGDAAAIVASHGRDEERIISAALEAGVPYVALVASAKRGAAVRDALGVATELSAQLHTPAGLDIGAKTPSEIAISILAELVKEHHAPPPQAPLEPATALDPICGMEVALTPQAIHLDVAGERVFFCASGCRDAYARLHAAG
ncbi:MAG: XdhC family protein [Solirubrobacterales bacterium]|nr:XdhC family protein [Solirubrobacterales bacterium]